VNRRKHYIALLLGVLYLFPVAYETIHKTIHKTNQGCDNTCHAVSGDERNSVCCQDLPKTNDNGRNSGYPQGVGFSTDYPSCPICEYTFTLVTEPDSATFLIVVTVLEVGLSFSLPEAPCTSIFFHPSLRAPPPKYFTA